MGDAEKNCKCDIHVFIFYRDIVDADASDFEQTTEPKLTNVKEKSENLTERKIKKNTAQNKRTSTKAKNKPGNSPRKSRRLRSTVASNKKVSSIENSENTNLDTSIPSESQSSDTEEYQPDLDSNSYSDASDSDSNTSNSDSDTSNTTVSDMEEDDGEFKCDVCGKSFETEDFRDAHRSLHAQEKRFKCIECYESFVRNSTLQAHRLKHLEKIHTCTVCSKTFKRAYFLRKHLLK